MGSAFGQVQSPSALLRRRRDLRPAAHHCHELEVVGAGDQKLDHFRDGLIPSRCLRHERVELVRVVVPFSGREALEMGIKELLVRFKGSPPLMSVLAGGCAPVRSKSRNMLLKIAVELIKSQQQTANQAAYRCVGGHRTPHLQWQLFRNEINGPPKKSFVAAGVVFRFRRFATSCLCLAVLGFDRSA